MLHLVKTMSREIDVNIKTNDIDSYCHDDGRGHDDDDKSIFTIVKLI